jgi:hypothetical protein
MQHDIEPSCRWVRLTELGGTQETKLISTKMEPSMN